jgi:dTMP kinase
MSVLLSLLLWREAWLSFPIVSLTQPGSIKVSLEVFPPEVIAVLENAAVGQCLPDLTLIFDLPAEQGLARAVSRGEANEDRFERKGRAFHEKLREGFAAIAAAEPRRCQMIDAGKSPDDVFSQVVAVVETFIHG